MPNSLPNVAQLSLRGNAIQTVFAIGPDTFASPSQGEQALHISDASSACSTLPRAVPVPGAGGMAPAKHPGLPCSLCAAWEALCRMK